MRETKELEAIKEQSMDNVSELRSVALELRGIVNDLEEERSAIEGQIDANKEQFEKGLSSLDVLATKITRLDEMIEVKEDTLDDLALTVEKAEELANKVNELAKSREGVDFSMKESCRHLEKLKEIWCNFCVFLVKFLCVFGVDRLHNIV
jgi:chromosome segregation ATPase